MNCSKWKKRGTAALRAVGVFCFWILFWWGCSALYGKPAIFPNPAGVFRELCSMVRNPYVYLSVLRSVLHVLAGLALGALVGILFGILIAKSRIADAFLSPFFSVARSTPVVCFILLAWIFLGREILPSFVSALMVAPVMLTATAGAIREVDPRLIEAAFAYRLSTRKRLVAVYLPSVLPAVRTSLVTCVGLAWKSCVAAEMIVITRDTVGYGIWDARNWDANYEAVFAWTIIIVTVSILFEQLAKRLLTPGKRGVS